MKKIDFVTAFLSSFANPYNIYILIFIHFLIVAISIMLWLKLEIPLIISSLRCLVQLTVMV